MTPDITGDGEHETDTRPSADILPFNLAFVRENAKREAKHARYRRVFYQGVSIEVRYDTVTRKYAWTTEQLPIKTPSLHGEAATQADAIEAAQREIDRALGVHTDKSKGDWHV